MNSVIKRNGSTAPFARERIADAMHAAFMATAELGLQEEVIAQICSGYAVSIEALINNKYEDPIHIESIQDEVEQMLMHLHPETAKAYILYRADRAKVRNRLMTTLDEIAKSDVRASDLMRENANIDGYTPMGTMLKFGSESAKAYYKDVVLPPHIRGAHEDGDIHIHDLDFLTLTTTCTQIDLSRLFSGGFSTGHGYQREPQSIGSYTALAAIAIQGNQNDQHGGQSIPNFDRDMAAGVAKTFRKGFIMHLTDILEVAFGERMDVEKYVWNIEIKCDSTLSLSSWDDWDEFMGLLADELSLGWGRDTDAYFQYIEMAYSKALRDTEKQTHQAMQAFVHNLNTMHSRAGAQVPFSSLNYGTDTSPEGRLVVKSLLQATEEGLGRGETPIFPIQIFRVKKGINFDPGDPNYDLFLQACQVSSKRLFPNFSFQDAPYNLQFYNPNDYRTEIAYMGCRTRVVSNVHDPEQQVTHSRGNLSFTTINLPRLAISVRSLPQDQRVHAFYQALTARMNQVCEQLLERYAIQAAKTVRNYPFLMGQGVWLDSEKLGINDTVGDVLKHGTLSIGFIGLAETLTALIGKHHGESDEAQRLGLEIISYMREFCDKLTEEKMMNFTLLATPAEGLSGRFVRLDRERYGTIEGVTDKKYYTNSFHIPVSYEILACDKISLEAPYHALTNAGHITYIELDGDPSHNQEAFITLVRHMAESGIGYGAINHPVDRDPVCGYTGIINDECPGCGRREGDGREPFQRIRRITGYLVGTLDRFNDAKREEEKDRVKHC